MEVADLISTRIGL